MISFTDAFNDQSNLQSEEKFIKNCEFPYVQNK